MCQDAVDTFWIEKENALVAEGDIGQFYRYVNNRIVSNSGIGVIKDETGTILRMIKLKLNALDGILTFELVSTQDYNKLAHAASKPLSDSFTDITFSHDNV